ncbi:hypothetical protein GCM10009001_09900 [Virgibacillus siamensis]|uniref:Uncharacterized protein n=1 Tax=Virgibacillus siamensis TaxID=480071 RepID=A0ABP3QS86_9BACI
MDYRSYAINNEYLYTKTTPKNDTKKSNFIMAGGVQADDETVIKR